MSPIDVLHRDEDLLVVHKPAHLATTSPGGRDSLARRVEDFDRHAERHHPSSRLDAEVTGVVVFARTSRGIERVTRARAEGRYGRRYVALAHAPAASLDPSAPTAWGAMEWGSMAWDWDIAIDPRDARLRRAIPPGTEPNAPRVQAAHTRARSVAQTSLAHALVLSPLTGRTHQLRVHAARAGLPLLGDVAYGGRRRLVSSDGRVVSCPRVALHCLVVVLPGLDGEALTFVAPVPADLESLTNALALPRFDVDAICREAREGLA